VTSRNGNGPPPSSGTSGEHALDVRTADLRDPAQLREVLVSIDETVRAHTRQHVEAMTAIRDLGDSLGPKIEAVSDDVRKGLDGVAAALKANARAFDAGLSLEALAREETDKGILVEVAKVNRRAAENREAINAISGPNVPDLAEVTKVRDVSALVKAQITEHTLDLTKAKLTEAQAAEKDRLAKADKAAEERSRRLFAVSMLVLGLLTGVAGTVFGAAILRALGLK
jgi:hypothetical protein